ncbi:hypothetical protein ABZW02_29535 [Streptomyces sp. NPDC005180]|uniref:hypothetical protein n=1 Tax=Streptomyces sp. NPDC005180 TaxID=3156868 RepID=UPI0033ADD0C4
MLWPALRALSRGDLTSDQLQTLLTELELEEGPRTEGPGAASSLAHRAFNDGSGSSLVLDLARVGESGWVLALFYSGRRPTPDTVEEHRALFRRAMDQAGLTLVEITPAATADEVLLTPAPPAGAPQDALGTHWPLPYEELDRVWHHLGLRPDAPREVKEVKLRELMSTPAWPQAPEALRRQAEDFLRAG